MDKFVYAIGIVLIVVVIILGYFVHIGDERLWGYRIEIDRNSALIRTTDYRFFTIRSQLITTNVVTKIASTIPKPTNANWELAVKRPVFRGEVNELAGARLVHAETELGMFLAVSDLAADRQRSLVGKFLLNMRTNTPKGVEEWVFDQTSAGPHH